jgi:hypothetical protein
MYSIPSGLTPTPTPAQSTLHMVVSYTAPHRFPSQHVLLSTPL